jgi:hypothetical protein
MPSTGRERGVRGVRGWKGDHEAARMGEGRAEDRTRRQVGEERVISALRMEHEAWRWRVIVDGATGDRRWWRRTASRVGAHECFEQEQARACAVGALGAEPRRLARS